MVTQKWNDYNQVVTDHFETEDDMKACAKFYCSIIDFDYKKINSIVYKKEVSSSIRTRVYVNDHNGMSYGREDISYKYDISITKCSDELLAKAEDLMVCLNEETNILIGICYVDFVERFIDRISKTTSVDFSKGRYKKEAVVVDTEIYMGPAVEMTKAIIIDRYGDDKLNYLGTNYKHGYDIMIRKSIGVIINKYILKNGYNLQEFSDISKYSMHDLLRIVNGEVMLSPDNISDIAKLLHTTKETIIKYAMIDYHKRNDKHYKEDKDEKDIRETKESSI